MVILNDTAVQFGKEGMLRHQRGGWMVIDRFPMRNCAEHKNCRNPYQVMNIDQSKYALTRSIKTAFDYCNLRTKYEDE